ncbi:transcriptional regulator [Salipaludibacillus keqinensis]|uniref:Transcriptional regulator n=1 Tax=Salipaludibacillus keqinensis TaxID=2045207 RepID=A0A323TM18_9BACI|nr:helix-turn-helix transcriptional regulator [Salipaludibacillus keqinensis]PYZ95074.1 transcriptional regulator [Salipaludibacillus keqinensis]
MIGHNIQLFRRKKGLTLTELAERANISKSNLSNIERNINQNPSIKVLEKLASVLDEQLISILGIQPSNQLNSIVDEDLAEFILKLKKQGITKVQLEEYKKVIEFIEWQHHGCKTIERKIDSH